MIDPLQLVELKEIPIIIKNWTRKIDLSQNFGKVYLDIISVFHHNLCVTETFSPPDGSLTSDDYRIPTRLVLKNNIIDLICSIKFRHLTIKPDLSGNTHDWKSEKLIYRISYEITCLTIGKFIIFRGCHDMDGESQTLTLKNRDYYCCEMKIRVGIDVVDSKFKRPNPLYPLEAKSCVYFAGHPKSDDSISFGNRSLSFDDVSYCNVCSLKNVYFIDPLQYCEEDDLWLIISYWTRNFRLTGKDGYVSIISLYYHNFQVSETIQDVGSFCKILQFESNGTLLAILFSYHIQEGISLSYPNVVQTDDCDVRVQSGATFFRLSFDITIYINDEMTKFRGSYDMVNSNQQLIEFPTNGCYDHKLHHIQDVKVSCIEIKVGLSKVHNTFKKRDDSYFLLS